MDTNAIVNALLPILGTILTGVITYLGAKVNKLIKAKISTEQYNKLQNIGIDAWHIGEEFFRLHPELKTSAESKAVMFATEVRKKIPYITDAELETLRQAIAGAINSDKPASSSTSTTIYNSPIQEPTTEIKTVIEPVKKYYAPDGTELQPIPNATTTAVQ